LQVFARGELLADEEIAIALAVVRNADGQVLIGRRHRRQHQGGLLEFPGGKAEPGEAAETAMLRELHEETGLIGLEYRPLITLPHRYAADSTGGERLLRISVFLVTRWQTDQPPGSQWQWLDSQGLEPQHFPAANVAILKALKLPDRLMVTADLAGSAESLLRRWQQALESGVKLICLRDPGLSDGEFQRTATQLLPPLQERGCQVMVNCAADLPVVEWADGLHLTSKRLMEARARPPTVKGWWSAACHDRQQLDQAANLEVDFVTLSPVAATGTHPTATPLGWQQFGDLAGSATVPVYALGGMEVGDLKQAWHYGGQGIAGISLFEDR